LTNRLFNLSDVGQLLSSLNEAKTTIHGSDEDFGFLSSLLNSREIQALIRVHSTISRSQNGGQPIENGDGSPDGSSLSPVETNCEDLAYEVLDLLHPLASKYREARELYYLLQKPHFQCLLGVHDSVAQKDYLPRLPDFVNDEEEEEEETFKIVQLVKSNEEMVSMFNLHW
jgi:hypothetical protein